LNSRLVSALVEQLNKLLEQAWRPELSVRHVSPGQRLPEELALELASLGMSNAPLQLVGVWVLRAGDSVRQNGHTSPSIERVERAHVTIN
jgi:hypothetical protein